MLLRVTRPLSGSVDGVDLTQFDAGRVYRFSTSVSQFLLAIGAAVPVDDDVEPDIWPARKQLFSGRRQSSAPASRWIGRERRRSVRD